MFQFKRFCSPSLAKSLFAQSAKKPFPVRFFSKFNSINKVSFCSSQVIERHFEDSICVQDFLGKASQLSQTHQVEEALLNYRKALELIQGVSNMRTLESGEVETLADIHFQKGFIHLRKNNLQMAVEHFEKAKDVLEQNIGRNPTVADCYLNLGLIHAKIGYYPESLKSLLQAASIYKFLGDEDSLSEIFQDIVRSYSSVGKANEVFEQLENKLDAYCILSKALQSENKHQQAVSAWNKTLALAKKSSPKNLEVMAECYSNLATIHNTLNQMTEAIDSANKCLQIKKKLHGKNSSELTKAYLALGDMYSRCDEFQLGLEAYQNALKINQKNPTSSFNTSYLHYKIGGIYLLFKEFNGAAKELENAIEVKRQNSELNPAPQLFELYEMLGVVYFEDKRYTESNQAFSDALKYCFQECGELTSEANQLYMALGSTSSLLQNFKEAHRNYQTGLQNQIKQLGENHHSLGFCYHGIANTYLREGELDQALKSFKKAVDHLQSQDMSLIGLYFDYGMALKQKSLLDEAIITLEKGMNIVMQMLGVGHEEMKKFTNQLQGLYQKQGRVEEVRKLEIFMR